MKHKNRIFRYKNKSIITNIDFSNLPLIGLQKTPHSVINAHIFDTKQELSKFLHDQKIYNAITIKCAYDPSAHVGYSQRMVARNAIFGNFGDKDKTPFIIENLHIKGKGKNAYFTAYTELTVKKTHDPTLWQENYINRTFTLDEYWELRKKMNLIVKRDTIEFTSYKWITCKIPVNSIIGTIVYWFTLLDNPDVIPYKDLNILKNHTIKFSDKRPNYREQKPIDRTHAGSLCANAPKDNTVHTYYSVKTVNSAGEIKWIRQNNCQLVNVDIQAEIAAGNIKPL